jgi:hypothetical protein
MLPALTVTTPLRTSASGACRSALTAPRILNEPIGCRFSSLSQISAGASTGRRTSGVRIAAPAIVSRARSISANGIRAPHSVMARRWGAMRGVRQGRRERT